MFLRQFVQNPGIKYYNNYNNQSLTLKTLRFIMDYQRINQDGPYVFFFTKNEIPSNYTN